MGGALRHLHMELSLNFPECNVIVYLRKFRLWPQSGISENSDCHFSLNSISVGLPLWPAISTASGIARNFDVSRARGSKYRRRRHGPQSLGSNAKNEIQALKLQ